MLSADIKARANTRFLPMTVARLISEQDREIIAGSYAIAGAFTKEAWTGYIDTAIKDAANKALQSTDWVLKTSARDDLSLEGNPEQIQRDLVNMYKTEYVREWQAFMKGIVVENFGSFDQAVLRMNRLGDPGVSPLGRLMQALHDHTAWDNPKLLNDRLGQAQGGLINWIKQKVMGVAPSQANVNLTITTDKVELQLGPIGREFAAVTRLVQSRESATPMRQYLELLSKVRVRLNQIRLEGDHGPASRMLMQQTLEGGGSELSEALRFVDEQMLTGPQMTDSTRAALRPLLVWPLMQAYDALTGPAEAEINRVWAAQVYEPFNRTLAAKYPFAAKARVEASAAEIAQIFGPEGAIAKFSQTTLGPLVIRRGEILSSRTWADMGIRLAPELKTNFGLWVAPLDATGTPNAVPGAAQTVFQLQPQAAPGLSEYTIDIDGQALRYRNAAPEWANFVWPGGGTPGARIVGLGFDGRTVEIVNFPGRFGLEKLVNAAQRKRVDDDTHELAWSRDKHAIKVLLRIVSQAGEGEAASPRSAGFRGLRLPSAIAGAVGPGPNSANNGFGGDAPGRGAAHSGVGVSTAGWAASAVP
jgi:type VI secretion system protein ImpL